MARATRSRRTNRTASRKSATPKQQARPQARSSKSNRAAQGKLGRGKRFATGIDIGQFSVKILSLGGDDNGNLVIRKVTVSPLSPPEEAEHAAELHARQKEALKEALKQHGKLEGSVVLGFPRHRSTVRYVNLPSNNPVEIRDMLLFDVERHVPFPADELELSFEIIGQAGEHESKILMICAPRNEIEPYTEMCQELGISVERMTLDVVGDMEAYQRTLDPEETTALVNFGRSSVNLGVVRQGTLLFSRSLPVSENNLLEGFAGAHSWKDLQGRITAAGPLNPSEKDHFSQWIDRIGLELMRSFSAYLTEHPEHRINRMILCGGAGYFPAGPPKGLHMRVQTNAVIQPPFNGELPASDDYRGAELATVFGLAMRGIRKAEDTLNLLPQSFLVERQQRERSNTRKNIGVLAFMILMLMAGAGYLRWHEQYREQSIVNTYFQELRTETTKINAMQKEIETVEKYLDKDQSALNIITAVLEVLPDMTYLHNISFSKRETLEITGQVLNQQEVDRIIQRLINLPQGANEEDRFFSQVNPRSTSPTQLRLSRNQNVTVYEFQINCILNYVPEDEDARRRR